MVYIASPPSLKIRAADAVPKNRGTAPSLKFRGPMDPVIWSLEALMKNKMMELYLVDASTMIVPRTYIDYKNRGGEMGRETFIRESSGATNHMFTSGLLSIPIVFLFNTLSMPYLFNRGGALLNGKGINQKAWINYNTLEEYGNTFQKHITQGMQDGLTPQVVRKNFIRDILGRFEATDRYSLAESLKKTLYPGGIPESVLARDAKLQHALKGRLDPNSLEQIVKMFDQSDSAFMGTYKLHEELANYRKVLEASYQAQGKDISRELSPTRLNQLLNRKRIERTGELIKTQKEFIQLLYEKCTSGNLSQEINILNEHGDKKLASQNLKTKLTELKYFLEQYGDRVLSDPKTGQLLKTPLNESQGAELLKLLSHEGRQGFLGGILPSAKDGLLNFTRKSHFWLSGIPIVATIIITGSVAFVNNMITQRRNHGKVFFPGIEGLAEKENKPAFVQPASNPFKQAGAR